jgi:hypothetical protein
MHRGFARSAARASPHMRAAFRIRLLSKLVLRMTPAGVEPTVQFWYPTFLAQRERVYEGMRKAGVPEV